MLDIREGDLYVVDSREYPIRSCAEWAWSYGRAMRRLCTVTASTKRNPPIVDKKRGVPITNLTSIKSTPLDPASAEIQQRLALNTPMELLQTYVDGGDVFYALILEDLKN